LKPNGGVVPVGTPKGGKWIGPLWGPLKSKIIQLFIDEEFTTLFAMANQADMELLRKLMSAGRIEPVIDRRYALRDVPEAMRYLQTWRARGTGIVSVESKLLAGAVRTSPKAAPPCARMPGFCYRIRMHAISIKAVLLATLAVIGVDILSGMLLLGIYAPDLKPSMTDEEVRRLLTHLM